MALAQLLLGACERGDDVFGMPTLDGDRLHVTARVPANTHGTVYLPGAQLGQVREGGSPLAQTLGVRRTIQAGDSVVVEVGSGSYEFAYDAPALAARVREGLRR